MGRPRKRIDEITLLKKRAEGKKLKEIESEMQISARTLSRRIAALKYKKGVLTRYRELQGLQLTEYQARILNAVEAKDFENASLMELLNAFNILKKTEIAIQGKESFNVRGLTLLEHLQALENNK